MDKLKLVGKYIDRYKINNFIASGSFGSVYEASYNTHNGIKRVAIKIPSEEKDKECNILMEEYKIYRRISNAEMGVANIKLLKYDRPHTRITKRADNAPKKALVMDLLGESIDKKLKESANKKLPLKTVILIAIQILSILKHIHSTGTLHRDIKPDNFVIGVENPNKIFCIDFGISKKYIDDSGKHLQMSEKPKFCGTARYASIAAHLKKEQGRKDDLEAVAYMLVYLYKGSLPWQNINHSEKDERYRLIGEKKQQVSEEELCSDMPREFCVFLKYTKNMDYTQKPFYSACKKMFKDLYETLGYNDTELVW